MAPKDQPNDPGLQTNMDADYVVVYRFATSDKPKATAEFEKLVQALTRVGLATEVRIGDKHSLLVFVKVASHDYLYGEVYRSRVRDWISGIRSAEPKSDTKKSLEDEPLYPAERLRILYQLITNPQEEGGAGITPKHGEWKNVESVFALHNHQFNKAWIKKWSTSYFLKAEDLDSIRDQLGEKIAYYFAFTQSYFTFLLFPAGFGFLSWLFLGGFSPIYAVVNSLWCIVFTEWWKHQEGDLAVRWGVKGVSKVEHQRQEFMHETIATDPVTGEKVGVFPMTTRLYRQLLQIPFAIAAAALLGTLIATCFGIEIFISEIYGGPLQWLLVFLPTGILTTTMPVLLGVLTGLATRLNKFENYETHSAYETALTAKVFVLNFITSYLPIFLTAFVYVPFASYIVPHLDIFSLTVRPFAEHEMQLKAPAAGFEINPDRLKKQVIYFTVTAQIVNLALELIVPIAKRKGFAKYKEFQSERALKQGGAVPDPSQHDAPEEKAFLARVRKEVELDVYDVTSDLREMVLQFGYLSLFSVVWPLVPVSFLANNWVELRADAMKICVEMQRPTPWRADTIGPWLDSLTFLTWLGSITTSALLYLFANGSKGPGGNCNNIKAWALLLVIIAAEHIFLVVRLAVRTVISKLDSPGALKERRERYVTRQQYFKDSLSALDKIPALGDQSEEVINRTMLEEHARKGSLKASTVEDRFWARQLGWRDTAKVGAGLIERAAPEMDVETKKEL